MDEERKVSVDLGKFDIDVTEETRKLLKEVKEEFKYINIYLEKIYKLLHATFVLKIY